LSWSIEILSSTCSSLLEWLSTVFCVWHEELFISKVSAWFFVFETFYIFAKLHFNILYCLLYFIYLFLKNVLGLISKSVEMLLEFI
jgi:hypothetical protein